MALNSSSAAFLYVKYVGNIFGIPNVSHASDEQHLVFGSFGRLILS